MSPIYRYRNDGQYLYVSSCPNGRSSRRRALRSAHLRQIFLSNVLSQGADRWALGCAMLDTFREVSSLLGRRRSSRQHLSRTVCSIAHPSGMTHADCIPS